MLLWRECAVVGGDLVTPASRNLRGSCHVCFYSMRRTCLPRQAALGALRPCNLTVDLFHNCGQPLIVIAFRAMLFAVSISRRLCEENLYRAMDVGGAQWKWPVGMTHS